MYFGTVKLTKNTDLSKSEYSSYGIGFSSWGNFFLLLILAGLCMMIISDNNKKYILVLVEGPK